VIAIGELDVLRHGHTVLRDFWHAKSSVKDDVAATRTKRDLNSISKHITALEHERTGFRTGLNFLSSEVEALSSDQLCAA